MQYSSFLDSKRHVGALHGFDPLWTPPQLFDFQQALVGWAIRKGRCALFADCGLGKTAMQLTWAENVARHTGKPVLVLTPLAVGAQTVNEGAKFGIDCVRSRDGQYGLAKIVVTNYEMLDRFHPDDFAGVVCDESSILKSFEGATRTAITAFMRKVPYRLLATATAAPNDYTELGTSSEALGELGYMDMLNRFFVNDQNNSTSRRMYGEAPTWRFKGHSQTPFWRWVASWARACRKPSDIGFDDGPMILPELIERTYMVETAKRAPGMLFALPARSLAEQRGERKRTIEERCEKAAELSKGTDPVIVWCQMNDEASKLRELIPDAVEVSGADRDDAKESKFLDFLEGRSRVLITKPKVGAWGLNFQHCARVIYFPSHSYEQYYQAVRRCWRFGQRRPVTVDVVLTEGERRVMDNMQRKSDQARAMFDALVAEMNNAQTLNLRTNYNTKQETPQWL